MQLVASNISVSEFRKLPITERKNVVRTLRHEWFYATSFVREIYDRIYDTLYQHYRYSHQDNFIPILNRTIKWHKEARDNVFKPTKIDDYAIPSFSIIGVSGAGKTQTTKRILRKCFHQVIDRGYTKQVTYLFTNCADVGSINQLLGRFMTAIDSVIGSDYFDLYMRKRSKLPELEAAVANVAHRHHVGVWIVDEIHHLENLPFKSAEQIINFLKNVSSQIGLPMIFIGTPDAKMFLARNFQIARRAEGDGSIFWGRYSRDGAETDATGEHYCQDSFEMLMSALWKRQVLRKPGKLSKQLLDKYYEISVGIMERIVSAHIQAQVIALNCGQETIDVEILDKAKQHFEMSAGMISALNSGKVELISDYPDLSMRSANLLQNVLKNQVTPEEFADMILESDFSKEDAKLLLNAFLSKYEPTDSSKTGDSRSRSHKVWRKKASKKGKNNKPKKGELVEKSATKTKGELYDVIQETGMTNLEPVFSKKEGK